MLEKIFSLNPVYYDAGKKNGIFSMLVNPLFNLALGTCLACAILPILGPKILVFGVVAAVSSLVGEMTGYHVFDIPIV